MKFVTEGMFALYVEEVLSSKRYYQDYLRGSLDSASFHAALAADTGLTDAAGFNAHNKSLISLTPPDERTPADIILGGLAARGVIPSCAGMYDGFDECRAHIRKNYDHGGHVTYIYPEDERLLYAAAGLRQPKRAFVAGAYYGYFAIWAMKALHENGGLCVLSDINEEVCALAGENFDRLGYGPNVSVRCEDAEALLIARTEPIDLLVLDATGRGDDPRPDRRGKRIYGALLRAAKHVLSRDAMIVIHNMEPENPEMQPLVDELADLRACGGSYATYNGVGVYVAG